MFNRKLACSFCGKRDFEVDKLVAGPRVYICDTCVAAASRIMQDSPAGGGRTAAPAGGALRRVWSGVRRALSPWRARPWRHTIAGQAQ